jgi:hypothetical protein
MNYLRVKAIVITAYALLVLIYLGNENVVNIAILAIDVYLSIDILTQVIVYGIRGVNSYFEFDLFVKLLYITTQILCIVFFFVDAPIAIETALHFTRIFVLFGCIPWLN